MIVLPKNAFESGLGAISNFIPIFMGFLMILFDITALKACKLDRNLYFTMVCIIVLVSVRGRIVSIM
jgi:hypothetical protein